MPLEWITCPYGGYNFKIGIPSGRRIQNVHRWDGPPNKNELEVTCPRAKKGCPGYIIEYGIGCSRKTYTFHVRLKD